MYQDFSFVLFPDQFDTFSLIAHCLGQLRSVQSGLQGCPICEDKKAGRNHTETKCRKKWPHYL